MAYAIAHLVSVVVVAIIAYITFTFLIEPLKAQRKHTIAPKCCIIMFASIHIYIQQNYFAHFGTEYKQSRISHIIIFYL